MNNIDKREKPMDPEALLQVLPIQFVKNLAPPRKGANVEFAEGDRISVVMITANANDIPQLKNKNDEASEKSFLVPLNFQLKDIVVFLWNQAKLSDFFLIINKDQAVPSEHLQVNLESKIVDESGGYELIPLDENLTVQALLNYLWIPLNPKWLRNSEKVRLIYSRKKKQDQGVTPM